MPAEHLSEYPGDLPQLIAGILRYGALTSYEYEGPAQLILSDNLSSATSAPEAIFKKTSLSDGNNPSQHPPQAEEIFSLVKAILLASLKIPRKDSLLTPERPPRQ